MNIAVIGLGVGAEHARAFARMGCNVRWLFDHEPEKSRAVAQEIGQGEIAPSWKAILDDPTIDIVSLATYDDDHAVQVVEALQAGKHVFCEKPLCTRTEEVDRIEQVWRASGRHLQSNLVLRAAPLYRRVRDLIQSGSFGQIYSFYGDYLYGRLSKITEGWRKDVDDYSVMMGGGVHIVDLMLWLCGEAPAKVRATGNRIVTEGSAFRYRDFVVATYDFPSGLIGVISANFGCVHRHQHVVRIFGTEATFLFDDQGARIFRQRDPGGPPEILSENPKPLSKGDRLTDFLEGIRDPRVGAAATVLDLSVIRACLAVDDALLSPVQ